MIGIGTALGDDPLLTVRLPGLEARAPLRVVIDTHLRLPLRSRLVVTAGERPLLVIAGEGASADARHALQDKGVLVETVPLTGAGHVDLAAALQVLGGRGVTRVFSEGGPQVAGALIEAGLADEVAMFRSAKPFGRAGLAALDSRSRAVLGDPSRYRRVSEREVGADLLSRFERIF